jgi:hypothetical protein
VLLTNVGLYYIENISYEIITHGEELGLDANTSGTIKHLRTLNGFRIHKAPRPNETSGFSRRTPNMHSFHYDWSSFGGVIFSSLPHATLCLSLVL